MENANRDITLGTSRIHEGVDKLAASVKEATLNAGPQLDRMAERAHRAIDRTSSVYDNSYDWVGKHPFRSLGVALAVGILIGRVL